MDKLDAGRRSENMRRIRSKNTRPEMMVRQLVVELGFRGYRLHRKDLPGRPDMAWIGRKKAIFVNGCFWHAHDCVKGLRKPKSNQSYWLEKLERNKARDASQRATLIKEGWEVITIWECELADEPSLRRRLTTFLNDARTLPHR